MANPTDFLGVNCKMSIAGTPVEFISSDIKQTIDIIPDESSRGTRTRDYMRVNQGQKHYGGNIVMNLNPADAALILPYCVNGTSTSSVVLTDTLQDVVVAIDVYTKTHTFTGRFSSLHLSGSPGQKLQATIGFVGKSYTSSAGQSISGYDDTATVPYVFSHTAGITLNGSSYQIDKFDLGIDHQISPTYLCGLEPTDLEPSDRVCTLGIQTKNSSTEQALLTAAQAGPTPGTPYVGSIAFTNGANSMSFAWASMVATSQTPTVGGPKSKIRLPLNYQLLGTTSGGTITREIVINLV